MSFDAFVGGVLDAIWCSCVLAAACFCFVLVDVVQLCFMSAKVAVSSYVCASAESCVFVFVLVFCSCCLLSLEVFLQPHALGTHVLFLSQMRGDG